MYSFAAHLMSEASITAYVTCAHCPMCLLKVAPGWAEVVAPGALHVS
jgi:tRNA(Arg) A34 adenosine deaminase TadA